MPECKVKPAYNLRFARLPGRDCLHDKPANLVGPGPYRDTKILLIVLQMETLLLGTIVKNTLTDGYAIKTVV